MEQFYQIASLCLGDHQFKQKELESVGCLQFVSKCLYVARIGRPDILWSVNMLARSVTKWTQTCDKRYARLITYIHHTKNFRQCCHVGNTAQHCRLGLFQECGGLKVNLKRCFAYFWKQNICPSQLDMQDTICCFAQFNRI